MNSPIHNRFIIKNQSVEMVQKKDISLWQKITGKTNLFKVLHKIQSNIKKGNQSTEKTLSEYKNRIVILEKRHQAKLKKSLAFRLMNALFKTFGLNFSKECQTTIKAIDTRLNKKDVDDQYSTASTKTADPSKNLHEDLNLKTEESQPKKSESELKKSQKEIFDFFTNEDYEGFHRYLAEAFRSINSTERIKATSVVLSDFATDDQISKLIDYNLKIKDHAYNPLIEFLTHFDTPKSSAIENVAYKLGHELIFAGHEVTKQQLHGTLMFLKPYTAASNKIVFDILDKGNPSLLNVFAALFFNNSFASYGNSLINKAVTSSQLTNISEKQLIKIIGSDLFKESSAIIHFFDFKTLKKIINKDNYILFYDKFIDNNNLNIICMYQDYKVNGLNEKLKNKIISIYFNISTEAKENIDHVIELCSDKNDTWFLFAFYTFNYNRYNTTNLVHLLDAVFNKISTLNDDEKPANVILKLYSSKIKSETKMDLTKKRKENKAFFQIIRDFDQMLHIPKDTIVKEILPKVYSTVPKIELEIMAKIFIELEDRYQNIRDIDTLNALMDFLLKKTAKNFGQFPESRFLKKYLTELQVDDPEKGETDSKAYAFVFEKLINHYTTINKFSLKNYKDINDLCYEMKRLRTEFAVVDSSMKYVYSKNVFEILNDDYKLIYIKLCQPDNKSEVFDFLNQYEFNLQNLGVWKVINELIGAKGVTIDQETCRPELFLLYLSFAAHHLEKNEYYLLENVFNTSIQNKEEVFKNLMTVFKSLTSIKRKKEGFTIKDYEMLEHKGMVLGLLNRLFTFSKDMELNELINEDVLQDLLVEYVHDANNFKYLIQFVEPIKPEGFPEMAIIKAKDQGVMTDIFKRIISTIDMQGYPLISQSTFTQLNISEKEIYTHAIAENLVKKATSLTHTDINYDKVAFVTNKLLLMNELGIINEVAEIFFKEPQGLYYLMYINADDAKLILPVLPDTKLMRDTLVKRLCLDGRTQVNLQIAEKVGPYTEEVGEIIQECVNTKTGKGFHFKFPRDYYFNVKMNEKFLEALNTDIIKKSNFFFKNEGVFVHNLKFILNHSEKINQELFTSYAIKHPDFSKFIPRFFNDEVPKIESTEKFYNWFDFIVNNSSFLEPYSFDVNKLPTCVSAIDLLEHMFIGSEKISKKNFKDFYLQENRLETLVDKAGTEITDDRSKRLANVLCSYLNLPYKKRVETDGAFQRGKECSLLLRIHRLGISEEIMESGCKNSNFALLTNLSEMRAMFIEKGGLDSINRLYYDSEFYPILKEVEEKRLLSNLKLFQKYQPDLFEEIYQHKPYLKNSKDEVFGNKMKRIFKQLKND